MRRLKQYIIIALLALLFPLTASSQGLPLLKNYTSENYQAHNVNYDIYAAKDGIVYVANFEGLLYYDKANWHIIHTPGITRITSLYCDKDDRIWAGGYNYLGYLEYNHKGVLGLHSIDIKNQRGEVSQLQEVNGVLSFRMSNGKAYQVKNNTIHEVAEQLLKDKARNQEQELSFGDDLKVRTIDANGLIVTDRNGKTVCHFTEEKGLCDNNISKISYDGHGTLWGATSKGIFTIAIPSKYSRYTAADGLKGEITDIEELNSTIYVSTTNGVYRCNDYDFSLVEGISHGCSQLYQRGNTLLAATGMGVYSIPNKGPAKQLTSESAISVMGTPEKFYCGELNRVMLYTNGQPTHIADIEKAVDIHIDNDNCLWIEDIYGQIWKRNANESRFSLASDSQTVATMIIKDNMVNIVTSADNNQYPLFTITDKLGYTWLTNYEGRHLYALQDGKQQETFTDEIAPLADYSIKALYHQNGFLWLGGEFGLIVVGHQFQDESLATKPELLFRSITLNSDSVIWGGFGAQPERLPAFDSNSRHITISFSTSYTALVGETHYRYRINGEAWTAWSTQTSATYQNMAYGKYTFEVQAMDAFGHVTPIRSLKFSIHYPFYMEWYMVIVYTLFVVFIVYCIARLRLRHLEQEKVRLENVVQERTAEVIQQKNEIEEKSVRLQSALDELAQTQHELIRQEKMATAGKLTQGLIDRILNPMNYINNFSKLSCGLLKDLKANIEDESENMDKENYEDTLDILEMLTQNLEKVEQHGLNTTRTLKAMEEILKDRSGGKLPMDVKTVLKQDEEMVHNYYKEKIEKYNMQVKFSMPEEEVIINGNPELLSMTFMSIFGNAIYALEKKAERQQYTPEISVTLTQKENMATIVVYDNGIGIESTIIEKIFDPFFTTKPTGEAAGIGLYLSHEVLQNHGGDIIVESEKDQHTSFTITIPTIQN